jgi:hypothetical protein
MAAFNAFFLSEEARKQDPETDCLIYSDTYESCRQTFYLKKQAELMKTAQQTATNNATTAAKISEFQGLIEQQNQQIAGLIENSRQDAQQINALASSLHTSYGLNIALGIVILGMAIATLFLKLKK